MYKITIFIPVSREDHLDRLFASLELLECKAEHTNLFVYVDGNAALFLKTRNFCEQSKFAKRLCIQRPPKGFIRQTSIPDRRKRIADIKNESKQYIGECDYIFGIEDDTIVPPNALSKLLRAYSIYPYAGFIQGVELGRWGRPYVGAWRANDIYDPSKLDSLVKGEGIEEIDAGGFYCYLTKRESYISHEYSTFDHNTLGPDVNFGLAMRQEGLKNYMDWSLICEHRRQDGHVISPATTLPVKITMERTQIKTLRGNIINNWKQHVSVE